MEQVVYEERSGQLLTASFMDYAMPRADTMCNIEVITEPVPTATNPLGARGAGEGRNGRGATRRHDRHHERA
jgi:aerobic carbon-monoxide dehydrogenase large subunit